MFYSIFIYHKFKLQRNKMLESGEFSLFICAERGWKAI